jgi:hypothetical protein
MAVAALDADDRAFEASDHDAVAMIEHVDSGSLIDLDPFAAETKPPVSPE